MIAALVEAGFSADAAARHVAMTRALSEGRIVSRGGRTPQASTPTPFETIAEELVKEVVW